MNYWSIHSVPHICIRKGDILFTKLFVSSLDNIYIDYITKIVFGFATDTNNFNSNYMINCSISSELNPHIKIGGSTFITFFVSLQDNIFINMILKFSMHYPLILVFIFELKKFLWYHLYSIYTTI